MIVDLAKTKRICDEFIAALSNKKSVQLSEKEVVDSEQYLNEEDMKDEEFSERFSKKFSEGMETVEKRLCDLEESHKSILQLMEDYSSSVKDVKSVKEGD